MLHRNEKPATARWATGWWTLAVAAGVAESVVGVINAIGNVSTGPLVLQIAFRTLVYGGLFVVIARYFRHGVRWSRYLLAGLLGTVGIASLVVGPIGWLHDHQLGELDWSAGFLLTAFLRTVHLVAVGAALITTFLPKTTTWFRTSSRTEAEQ